MLDITENFKYVFKNYLHKKRKERMRIGILPQLSRQLLKYSVKQTITVYLSVSLWSKLVASVDNDGKQQ